MTEVLRNITKHQSRRRKPIMAIVLHRTQGATAESALHWFAAPASKVSSHVVIDKDGTVYRVVLDDAVAWHAGSSSLFGQTNVNVFSLGVELVGKGAEDYPTAQLDAAAVWCAEKARLYGIPLNRIVGHDMISPSRKIDPQNFPWSSWLINVAVRL